MSDSQEMRIVRDLLEEELGPDDAAKLLFTALDEPDAEMEAEALFFVRGAMKRVLMAKLGGERAAVLVEKMELALDPMGGITIDESAFDDSTVLTRSIGGADSGPLKVLVLARSGKLVRKLEVALGPENIGAAAARDEQSLSRLEGVLSPDVVIVDGQSAADVSPQDLAEVLAANPERMILIWCADQPAGSAVKNALEAKGTDFVAIPRSAGVDPLIDYLRARMSGG
jgi:hypothetical protein